MRRARTMLLILSLAGLSMLLPRGASSRMIEDDPGPAALADPSIVGRWAPPVNLPAVAIHSHVLPNGNVLFWGGTGQPWLLDVGTGVVTPVNNPYVNVMCSGHSFLPDGRLLVGGGQIQPHHGQPHLTVFDYRNNTWSRFADMNNGRWYPTACTLADGTALTVAGEYFNGSAVVHNSIPQVWRPNHGWRSLTGAPMIMPLYPFMFLAPNGKVFNSGPSQSTFSLDTAGTGSWSPGPPSVFGLRDAGTSVMYDDGKLLIVGGGQTTNTAEVINISAESPRWRQVSEMAFPRRHLNATILADGKILVSGGTSSAGFNNADGSVLAAEIWDPTTERWTTVASMRVRRLYHSTAVLLPDGRVLSAGGGQPPASGGNPPDADHSDMEVYSPPYLFKGPRPAISASPNGVSHGETFFVRTPDHAAVSDVILVRLSSVTHSLNQNQRINHLSFTPATQGVDAIGVEDLPALDAFAPATGLNVTAPGSSTLCPPGHYMMFLVNSNGVPSIAKIVRITTTTPADAIDDQRYFVRQQFYDLLNREPSATALQNRTRQITQCLNDAVCRGQKRVDVSRSIWDSAEFQRLFPAVVNPGGNPRFVNAEFVRLCYVLYLRRNPDPGGYNYWLNLLNGMNDYNHVISGFINSTEYRARFGQP